MQSKGRRASTGSSFGGTIRRVLRRGALLVVLLLVACIGLVIGEGSVEHEPSPTELALVDSAAAAQALALSARTLAETGPSPDAAAYAAASGMLGMHAAALRPAGSAPEDSSPVFSPAETTPPGSRSAEPASPAGFLSSLTDSYTKSFEAAATVDPGPARVLASAATAQWLQGRALAERLGAAALPAPVADVPPPSVGDVPSDDDRAPGCRRDGTAQPDPGLEGTRTAVLAEQRASYAYEVVAARAGDPAPFLQRMAQHQSAAAAGSAVLAQHCVAAPLPPAAYALDRSFLSGPDDALQELEGALVATYADLVGVSTPGPVRNWAIQQLARTAQRVSELDGGELEAFPGVDPREYPRLPEPAS